MLDLIYEIEGLTELAIRRDPMPEAILPLIAEKTFLLNALAQAMNHSGEQATTAPHEDVSAQEAESASRQESTENHTQSQTLPPHIKGAPKPPAVDIKKIFSINDKFRFRRELFVNDADDFSHTLDLIMKMKTYEDAEEYFYNEMQWDPENEEVMAFMAKVQEYFEK